MERDVLRTADAVLTVSWRWAEELAAIGGRPVEVITNGYDTADLPVPTAAVDEHWSLVHVGSIPATRDVPALWEALGARIQRDAVFRERFVLRFVGGVDHRVMESLRNAGLEPYVERVGQVSHTEALRHMQRARTLLLPVNDTPNAMGFLPAKVFEYLSVRRPVLCVAPAGADIARVLGTAHTLVPRGDAEAMQHAVDALFTAGEKEPAVPVEYDRVRLTERLAGMLEGVVKDEAEG